MNTPFRLRPFISRYTWTDLVSCRFASDGSAPSSVGRNEAEAGQHYPNTSAGIRERTKRPEKADPVKPLQTPYPPFPGGKNPVTGEEGGPTGPEPTRFGDWERKGRVTDF